MIIEGLLLLCMTDFKPGLFLNLQMSYNLCYKSIMSNSHNWPITVVIGDFWSLMKEGVHFRLPSKQEFIFYFYLIHESTLESIHLI